MATIKQLEDLDIWKLLRSLCDDIQKVANRIELRKDYKLYSQMDGSSGSVMDNIAEGFERNGNKELFSSYQFQKLHVAKQDLNSIVI